MTASSPLAARILPWGQRSHQLHAYRSRSPWQDVWHHHAPAEQSPATPRPSGAARALDSSPLSNEQVLGEKYFCLFLFNVIIYRVNIHCSYTDDRLQSTGVYSGSLRRPAPSLLPLGRVLHTLSPGVSWCNSGSWGRSTGA